MSLIIKNTINIIISGALIFSFASCSNAGENNTGDSYTHDMMYSVALEPYYLNPEMSDSMGALMPVTGTVPYIADTAQREMMLPYEMPNTEEGYETAGRLLRSPLDQTDQTILARGKHFYDIYCSPCHGFQGDGLGYIVTAGKYKAVPPSYFAEGYIDLPDGKIFHVITFGKGEMQPYSPQVNKRERWEIVAYINSLQGNYIAKNGIPVKTAVPDSTAAAATN